MSNIEWALQKVRQQKRPQSGHAAPTLEPPSRRVSLRNRILERHRVITLDSAHPAKASYKMLRTRVLRRMQQNNWKSLAVTAVGEGEGKTLTSINLAISIAGLPDHSACLIDLDLRSPHVHHYLGIDPNPGLGGWLQGNAGLEHLLVSPGIPRLVLLPNGRAFDDSSEQLNSTRMRELVEALKTRYPDMIRIFDMPPLLSADDVLTFLPHVDALLLVICQGKTQREHLERAKNVLEEATILGVVLNKSEESDPYYYY